MKKVYILRSHLQLFFRLFFSGLFARLPTPIYIYLFLTPRMYRIDMAYILVLGSKHTSTDLKLPLP